MLAADADDDQQPDTDEDHVDDREATDAQGELNADVDHAGLQHIAEANEEGVDRLLGLVFGFATRGEEEGASA